MNFTHPDFKNLKCSQCGVVGKRLVVVRMTASNCEECYKNKLAKRKVLRQINKIAKGELE